MASVASVSGAAPPANTSLSRLRIARVSGIVPKPFVGAPYTGVVNADPNKFSVCGMPYDLAHGNALDTAVTPYPLVFELDARGLLGQPVGIAQVAWQLLSIRPGFQRPICTSGTFTYTPLSKKVTLSPTPYYNVNNYKVGNVIFQAQLLRLGKVISATGATQGNPSIFAAWRT